MIHRHSFLAFPLVANFNVLKILKVTNCESMSKKEGHQKISWVKTYIFFVKKVNEENFLKDVLKEGNA